MGTAPLTRRNWYLFFFSVAGESSIAAFLWHLVAGGLAASPLHTSSIIALLGVSALSIFFLFWFRQVQTRNTWVYAWMFVSPLFLSSIFLLSFIPFYVLVGLWVSEILVALWGYYARFYPLLGHDSRLHKARYARRDELAELYSFTPEPNALLLGMDRLRNFSLVRPVHNRRELGNMLIVGPTRSGKGLLATSQLLSWKHSVIVNDIKGDLFEQTAGYRATLGQVYVIDPTGYGHRYDPLINKNSEQSLFSAATRLLFATDEGEGKIFTDGAIKMLTQMFLAARKENQPPFIYVRTLIRSGLQATGQQLQSVSPELATQFLDAPLKDANFSTNRFLIGKWETLTVKLYPLLNETVICSLNGTDFTPEEIMKGKKPVTIYLRWPEQDMQSLFPLVKLMWSSIIDELTATYDKAGGKDCNPVLLLIDEAGRTAIPSLSNSSATVVGRGMYIWLAIQSLAQLENIYGKANAQVLRDNMESQIYYRPTDLATAEYLEHRIGRKSEYAKSTTERGHAESSHGQSEQGIPLMTAQEIMQMKDEQVIGFHRRLPPFKMRRVDFRQNQTLLTRKQLPAPHVPTLQPFEAFELPKKQMLVDEYVDPDNVHGEEPEAEIIRKLEQG